MLAILSKELKSYFRSAMAYIYLVVFLFLSGFFFATGNVMSQNPQFSDTLNTMGFIFLLISPILTMRTIAEETRSRTDQLLLTSPQSVTSIVVGKFLAAVCLFLISLGITLILPLLLSIFGKLAVAQIFSTYLGIFLMGSCYIAVGVFISSLTESQLAAAVATVGVLIVLWLLNAVTSAIPTSLNSGIVFAFILLLLVTIWVYSSMKNIIVTAGTFVVGAIVVLAVYLWKKTLYEGFIVNFLDWFSILKRNDNFTLGIIDASSVVYYLSFAFIFVFLTIRVIEKRRWN